MNYPKKINQMRRRKQDEATESDGMVKVDGIVTLAGKATTYYPRTVLTFKPGTAAVTGSITVERMTKVNDLPPMCPQCEARA